MLQVLVWASVAIAGIAGLILGEANRHELSATAYTSIRIGAWAFLVIGGLLAVRVIADHEPPPQPRSTHEAETAAKVAKVTAPVLLFGLACTVSVLSGTPPKLPGSALGWSPLLHVERAGAVLAAIGVVWLVGWRALHGHFPIKFGNVEYADEFRVSAEAATAHEGRLKAAETTDELLERRLELVEGVLGLAEPPRDDLQ